MTAPLATAGAAAVPVLRRNDLPFLHADGTIRFRAVLRFARGQRRQRREADAKPRLWASCTFGRFNRVREDIVAVRTRIADDRAFWSSENKPIHAYETRRVKWFGYAWDEPVYLGTAAAADAEGIDLSLERSAA